jgi:ABC-type nickel/cobalt efflux system permease component RcnA
MTTAAGIGIFHTAIGVDHYVPFVAMSKANGWSFAKTMVVVFVCGAAHVLSSIILGLCGILLGSQVSSLIGIQDFRGEVAVWFLIAFGAVYMLWGIRNAVRNRPHKHVLTDGKEVWHNHDAVHGRECGDEHSERTGVSRSFWPLFILFVLGPCELLIPLLMFPAAQGGMMSVIAVAAVFAFCTVGTMLVCAGVVLKGIDMIPAKKIERYSHSLAGFAVLMCGLAIQFLGI